MASTRIDSEREALESLMGLFEQAKKCQQLYEKAHMAIPEPLQRFLGINGIGSNKQSGPSGSGVQIPPPEKISEPEGAENGWIWINVEDASPTSVTLAIL